MTSIDGGPKPTKLYPTTPQRSKKVCANCVFFARYDWTIIRDTLDKHGHSGETKDQYWKSFSGPDGRCLKRNLRTPDTDWCKEWSEREPLTYSTWPTSMSEASESGLFNPPKLYDGPKKPKETK